MFIDVYRQVTALVAERVTDGTFADPAFVEDLDVRFAQIFLDVPRNLAAGRPVSKAWQPLVDRRVTRGVLPIQLALAGMNAHINHDLALALVATCRARRREPESGSIHADFEKVNAVLAEVVRPIRRSFLDEAVIRYGAGASPLVDLVSNFSIDKARDAAWVSGLTLWHLRGVAVRARRGPRLARPDGRPGEPPAAHGGRARLQDRQHPAEVRHAVGGVARLQRDGEQVDVVRLAAGREADPRAGVGDLEAPAAARDDDLEQRVRHQRAARRGRPGPVRGGTDRARSSACTTSSSTRETVIVLSSTGPRRACTTRSSGPSSSSRANAARARASTSATGSCAISAASSRVVSAMSAARAAYVPDVLAERERHRAVGQRHAHRERLHRAAQVRDELRDGPAVEHRRVVGDVVVDHVGDPGPQAVPLGVQGGAGVGEARRRAWRPSCRSGLRGRAPCSRNSCT